MADARGAPTEEDVHHGDEPPVLPQKVGEGVGQIVPDSWKYSSFLTLQEISEYGHDTY